jgi:hypothetical protein
MSSITQRSFASGEITPALYARVDVSKYATGLKTLRNMYVMRHGGATNRPGTQFVCEVKDSTTAVRLVPFVFNTAQTYILEFGDTYMRVIKNGAQVTNTAQNITGVTQADPCVVTIVGHGYSTGDEVYISSVGGMSEINGRNFRITSLSADTFSLQDLNDVDIDSSAYTAYTSGGTAADIYEIATPYVEADLMDFKFVQSADVITIAHPGYAPRTLSRSGDTSWSLAAISFAPEIGTPSGTPTVTPVGVTGSTTYTYKITAIHATTFEESLASSVGTTTTGNATLSSANYNTISWSAVSGAGQYNIYRALNGVYGFVGIAGSTTFNDIGAVDPDTSDTPPAARNPFSTTGDYPSCVTYYQQRLLFANQDNDTEACYASRTANFYNYTTSSPTQDDDAVTFSIVGRQVNEIHNMIDLGTLVLFTETGEHAAQGDAAGLLTPGQVNLKQYSYNGSKSNLSPIIVGNTALYVQARGGVVRDLGFDFQSDGYRGNDLTIYSSHLVDGYELIDWAYQQIPHSIVWAVRDDGALLGLTYIKEQEMLAWHRHDFQTDTYAENVTTIPGASEDEVYLVINRVIDGYEKRYVEKFSTRFIDNIKDATFLDSHLSYDGRNTSLSHTMALSGGTNWTYDETLTCTSSTGFFTAADVGNEIHFNLSDGGIVRFTIEAYTSSTVVTGKANRTVPAEIRSTVTLLWSRAVDEISGLWHLEGESVSVFADGYVVANPNNPSYAEVTVEDGAITLTECYTVIHIGLPYTSDIETLNIDNPGGETISDKKCNVSAVTLFVEKSRGGWVGGKTPSDSDLLDGLTEVKVRSFEGYDEPVELVTGTMDVNIRAEWNSNGRIFIRQIDPLPWTVLAVVPAGLFPFKG